MKNEYDCEIITDLLPLYLDGQVSYETGMLVVEHLKNCSSCREIYDSMDRTIENGPTGLQNGEKERPGHGVSRSTAMKPGKIRFVNVMLAVIFGYILLNVAVCTLIFIDIILF